jgi:hypothetical protein
MGYINLKDFGAVCQRVGMRKRHWWRSSRGGYILLLMILLTFVIGAVIWLGMLRPSPVVDANLPWNQEQRLVGGDEEVAPPTEAQPKLTRYLEFAAIPFHGEFGQVDAMRDSRGRLEMTISPTGRVLGAWSADYNPTDEVNYSVVGAGFSGNIDSSNVYSDENGEDPSKLYFISKGRLSILKTNLKNNRISRLGGAIYVTGWLDHQYNIVGDVIITSDRITYQSFYWVARALD